MTTKFSPALLLIFSGFALAAANPIDPGTASRIALAKEQIAKNSRQPDGYTALAMAYVKAARSTGSPAYLQQAEQAVDDALRAAPDYFEAHKARVMVRLAQRRYTDALDLARSLNQKVPDDNLMYGFIADAQIALGDYAAAEKAAQRMIDQRAVNAPGLQRGAALREIFGYNSPALEWWNSALRLTSASDLEERAWILANMSRVDLRLGKPTDAETHARQSLELIATYPLAADALAAALLQLGKASEAAVILSKRLEAAPDLSASFHLAAALDAPGNQDQAAAAWQSFETQASASVNNPVNANRELIEYCATHGKIDAAIKLGAAETTRRKDVDTLAAYASALASAGRFEEARAQMKLALVPGIRDAKLFLRAAKIALKVGDKPAAAAYLKQAIEINATSADADQAIRLLSNPS